MLPTNRSHSETSGCVVCEPSAAPRILVELIRDCAVFRYFYARLTVRSSGNTPHWGRTVPHVEKEENRTSFVDTHFAVERRMFGQHLDISLFVV